MVQQLRSFYWRGWFCLLVELHREGCVPAACAAGLLISGLSKMEVNGGKGCTLVEIRITRRRRKKGKFLWHELIYLLYSPLAAPWRMSTPSRGRTGRGEARPVVNPVVNTLTGSSSSAPRTGRASSPCRRTSPSSTWPGYSRCPQWLSWGDHLLTHRTSRDVSTPCQWSASTSTLLTVG